MMQVSPMPFFKRILDFKQAALARLRNKRKAERYPVGGDFPLKGTLGLRGQASASCDWAGSPANLSANGASLLLPPAAITTRGEKTSLRLAIDQFALQVPCVVTHFRVLSTHAVCGLALEFPDFTARKAYTQVLEAVRIGGSFAPAKNSALARCPAGLSLEQYRADSNARLSVWRQAATRKIDSFELMLGDHCLRGEADGPTLEVKGRQDGEGNVATDVTGEVRQLARWVILNMNKEVPADVRAFLRAVINETRTPAERKIAKSFPPPTAFASPASFPPPRRAGTRPPQKT
jgi:hypothetical protein